MLALLLLLATVLGSPGGGHGVGSSPPATMSLEKLVAFDVPGECVEGPKLESLTGTMLSYDEGKKSSVEPGAAIVVPGFGRVQPFIAEAGRGWVRTVLPVSGTWHGLSLLRIEKTTGIESGPNHLHLIFAEPVEIALPVVNRLGFNLPAAGTNRIIEDEVIDVAVGLHPDGAGSALSCFVD